MIALTPVAHSQDSRSRSVSIHSKTSLPPTFVKQLVRPNKYNLKINVESSANRSVHVCILQRCASAVAHLPGKDPH